MTNAPIEAMSMRKFSSNMTPRRILRAALTMTVRAAASHARAYSVTYTGKNPAILSNSTAGISSAAHRMMDTIRPFGFFILFP